MRYEASEKLMIYDTGSWLPIAHQAKTATANVVPRLSPTEQLRFSISPEFGLSC
jgi:hypothetical protein